jgi:selenophosphate synthase
VDLSEIIRDFALAAGDPHLIVGFDTGDDAGVYRITDDLALVQTVDYITPVVDDPYVFGQVAAANALSDVYAMGGRPLTAMNICNFPAKGIDNASLRRILEGGWNKIREAGATLVGGHTVRDDELKYGLSVTGLIDPRRVVTNAGARPGDRPVLTQTDRHRRHRHRAAPRHAPDAVTRAVGWMTMLNRIACDHVEFEILPAGITDWFMGRDDDGARQPVRLQFPGRCRVTPRRSSSRPRVDDRHGRHDLRVDRARDALPADARRGPAAHGGPQTSGGLLIGCPADSRRNWSDACASGLTEAGEMGEVIEASGGETGLISCSPRPVQRVETGSTSMVPRRAAAAALDGMAAA